MGKQWEWSIDCSLDCLEDSKVHLFCLLSKNNEQVNCVLSLEILNQMAPLRNIKQASKNSSGPRGLKSSQLLCLSREVEIIHEFIGW